MATLPNLEYGLSAMLNESLYNHALRAGMVALLSDGSSLGLPGKTILALQDHVTPAALHGFAFFADAGIKDLHPAFFVGAGIGIEINDFTVVESDSEAFFNKHVAFFLFSKP